MIEIVFYIALAFLAYAYVGFPLLVAVRAIAWKRPYCKEPIAPKVSMIIACRNEEAGIGAKLENVLSLEYPREQIEVIIASDGSTDGSATIVRKYADRGVKLLELPDVGKAAALNQAVFEATGEILVFSDANSIYGADAVGKLVQAFADPKVGGVAGNQVYRDAYDAGIAVAGERGYWSFDRWLKTAQSRSGNTTSATGAIYAVRRSLFQNAPDGVTDDFVTSTRVIAQGYRLVFEPDAACYEPVAGAARAEFRRKTRVITRGLRGLLLMRELLNPFRHGFYALQLLSHKVLRRLAIFPLIVLAVTTPFLWAEGIGFQAVAQLQLLSYGAALVGLILARTGIPAPKPISIPFYFCMVNFAALVAVLRVIRGHRIERWEPQRGLSTSAESEALHSEPCSSLQEATS